MNPTIEKIIAHLFEDVERTEETRAIYEEIRTNCQERYSDARERGLSEDEAIHDVLESLSGMEEMLRPYARDRQEAEDAREGFAFSEEHGDAESFVFFDENEEQPLSSRTFDPAQTPIREIRLSRMTGTDVALSPSDDGLVHISWDETGRAFSARMVSGALLIEPSPSEQETPDLRDASLNTLPEKLGRMLSGIFQNVSISFGGGTGGSLSMTLPADLAPALYVGTASGNVEVHDLSLAKAHLSSTSGDIRLFHTKVAGELRTASTSGDIQADDVRAKELSLASSTSGDIRLTRLEVEGMLRMSTASGDIQGEDVHAGEVGLTSSSSGDMRLMRCTVASQLHLKTTSGDITWEGGCPSAEITSISGDLHIGGAFETLRFKTVSGDVMIPAGSPKLREIFGQTVSGNIRLRLPADLRACVSCRSVSGDVHQSFSSFADGEARVTLQTTSGGISVR